MLQKCILDNKQFEACAFAISENTMLAVRWTLINKQPEMADLRQQLALAPLSKAFKSWSVCTRHRALV